MTDMNKPNRIPAASPQSSPDPLARVRQIAEEMMRTVLPAECARLADDIERRLRQEWGGTEVGYVPARTAADRAAIIAGVRRSFNGRNATATAREYGISRASVYRYLKMPGE